MQSCMWRKKNREICEISRKVSGGDGVEVELFAAVSPDFDLFCIHLKQLLNLVDDMEKSAKKEN